MTAAAAPHPSVAEVDGAIEIIEHTRLPGELVIARLETVDAVIEAIHRLAVRGAPAIGGCGALAVVLGLDERRPDSLEAARAGLDKLAGHRARRPRAA